jgi:hypothetical protein
MWLVLQSLQILDVVDVLFLSDSVETLDILRYSETGQSKVKIILLESFFLHKRAGRTEKIERI